MSVDTLPEIKQFNQKKRKVNSTYLEGGKPPDYRDSLVRYLESAQKLRKRMKTKYSKSDSLKWVSDVMVDKVKIGVYITGKKKLFVNANDFIKLISPPFPSRVIPQRHDGY